MVENGNAEMLALVEILEILARALILAAGGGAEMILGIGIGIGIGAETRTGTETETRTGTETETETRTGTGTETDTGTETETETEIGAETRETSEVRVLIERAEVATAETTRGLVTAAWTATGTAIGIAQEAGGTTNAKRTVIGSVEETAVVAAVAVAVPLGRESSLSHARRATRTRDRTRQSGRNKRRRFETRRSECSRRRSARRWSCPALVLVFAAMPRRG